jgi:predicted Zn-ribbon and HTH transcriptional regulator
MKKNVVKEDLLATETCLKCGHRWFKRTVSPLRCPKCTTFRWNKPQFKKKQATQKV